MAELATVLDPDGRSVVLTRERWRHITSRSGHPELSSHLAEVLLAVRNPSVRLAGRRPEEEWFYLADAGPSRYLKVVVAFSANRGYIVTAFARRSLP